MSVTRRRATALATALFAALGLLVTAQSAGAQPALHHGPVHKLTHASSSNWAGWDNTGSTYTSVSASWVQPAVTCARRETSYSSFWVGLDGDGSNSVEQTGSEADCSRGTPTYYSWYEFYPAYPVNYSNTVRPGDQFSASVTYSSGTYTLVLTDSTQGWSHTQTGTAPSALNASAEVIAEAPSSNRGVLPLANFGTMNFTNAKVNGSALGTVPTPQKITMVTNTGATKAAVSNLTNNANFSVTWQHS
jgi:hypothetical protein